LYNNKYLCIHLVPVCFRSAYKPKRMFGWSYYLELLKFPGKMVIGMQFFCSYCQTKQPLSLLDEINEFSFACSWIKIVVLGDLISWHHSVHNSSSLCFLFQLGYNYTIFHFYFIWQVFFQSLLYVSNLNLTRKFEI
jgi:hypothetical protein